MRSNGNRRRTRGKSAGIVHHHSVAHQHGGRNIPRNNDMSNSSNVEQTARAYHLGPRPLHTVRSSVCSLLTPVIVFKVAINVKCNTCKTIVELGLLYINVCWIGEEASQTGDPM